MATKLKTDETFLGRVRYMDGYLKPVDQGKDKSKRDGSWICLYFHRWSIESCTRTNLIILRYV